MFFLYANFQRSQKHHCYKLLTSLLNVFEAVQKTRSKSFTCIRSKTTQLRLVVLNPDKTLLLMF